MFSLLGSRLERECALQIVLPGCAPIIEIIPVDHMKRKYTNITVIITVVVSLFCVTAKLERSVCGS